ncbi:hypothetical protein J2T17_002143 [Paenibacillus mucilaginosus]|uniref:hypothetical protein n=1 Tax=Paenibacillus mucilaginosus TaxID=61624 RepID=UPI003D1DB780
MLNNVLVILGSLLVMAGMSYGIIGFINKFYFPKMEKVGKYLGAKFSSTRTIFILEIVFLSTLLLYCVLLILAFTLYDISDQYFSIGLSIVTFIVVSIILILASALHELRKLYPTYKSFILKKFQSVNINKLKEIYLVDRLIILFRQGLEFLYVFFAYVISMVFLVKLKWTPNVYFLSFCFTPLYANYWVYFTGFFCVNEKKNEVLVRRVFIYSILALFITYQVFVEFQQYIYERKNVRDWLLFMFAGSGVMYIAFDRILKEVTVDYIDFKESRPKK